MSAMYKILALVPSNTYMPRPHSKRFRFNFPRKRSGIMMSLSHHVMYHNVIKSLCDIYHYGAIKLIKGLWPHKEAEHYGTTSQQRF